MMPEPDPRADRGSSDADRPVVHLPRTRPDGSADQDDTVVDLRPSAGMQDDAVPSLFSARAPIDTTAEAAGSSANGAREVDWAPPASPSVPLPPNDTPPGTGPHGAGPRDGRPEDVGPREPEPRRDAWPLDDPAPPPGAPASPGVPRPPGSPVPSASPGVPRPPGPPTPSASPGVPRPPGSPTPSDPIEVKGTAASAATPPIFASTGTGPPVERRSPEVVASVPRPPSPVEEPPPEPAASPSATGSLAGRTMRVLAPTVLVLVVAVVVAAVLSARASTAQADADRLADAAASEQERRGAVDAAWAGVLASVAGGVGQVVQDPAGVSELIGVLRAEVVATPDDTAAEQRGAAEAATESFASEAESALDRAGGSPVELGNELETLDEAHGEAVATSTAFVETLDDLADTESDAAARWRLLSMLSLLIGVVAALLLAAVAHRRLRAGLDRPVADLHAAVARVGGATPNGPVTVRGYAELAELGVELDRHSAGLRAQLARLRRRAAWGEQSRRIFEALDLAEDEAATHRVVSQALAGTGADQPVELLLAERGSTSLHQVAANPSVPAPGCPVDSLAGCVALRRAQVSVFDDSESINACPKLREHAGGPCSAVCVPVSVSGRPVGVLHVTGPQGSPPQGEVVEQLVDLSSQLGTRLSSLRVLERSRHEASTDGLTGLPNRRTLESEVAELFERGTPFVMVLADLDRFKLLNDNFGHEVGDRALQLFAGVLRDNVRGNDVVARLGGEEFVLVYPNMSTEISLEAIDRVRGALASALATTNLPSFTCSFGIAHSDVAADGDAVLRVADAGLLQAKDLGGDQAVVADAELAQEIFREGAPLRSRRDPQS